ncbi:MAG: tetratricopeptide repeat protein [Acidobacteriota bacterium]|nr:tetratricopeptide repeat protein [Acidobacteriota bacterium]
MHRLSVPDYSGNLEILVAEMNLRIALLLALATMSTAVSADDRSDAKRQVEFGIEVAERGLWREATYRWNRAVEIDPTYAAAWNNLAIAYEHAGKFDDARKAYEQAGKLDPDNLTIQQNFDLFKELNERTTR